MGRIGLVIIMGFALVGVAEAKSSIRVTSTEVVLPKPIYFNIGKDTIMSVSHALLDQLAATLTSNKRITLVEIQVHSDAMGNDQWNLELSQKRANAIHGYLVAKGVDPGRLRAKGYGETKPIDRTNTAKARAKNRRTTFVILQRRTA